MARSGAPTVPDLVVLSLLAEAPRHGYDLNAELERRDVRDWAGISRPQVYYSLKKAHAAGWIALEASAEAPAGPERQVYWLTPAGRQVLADALEREDWATDRTPPPFLTWLALSAHARPRALPALLARRRAYLTAELARERGTLAALRRHGGSGPRTASWMVDLTIRQFGVELDWLDEVEADWGEGKRR